MVIVIRDSDRSLVRVHVNHLDTEMLLQAAARSMYPGRFVPAGVSLSFPPKTGPLFLETEGGCDGSETTFGRGHTEAAA